MYGWTVSINSSGQYVSNCYSVAAEKFFLPSGYKIVYAAGKKERCRQGSVNHQFAYTFRKRSRFAGFGVDPDNFRTADGTDGIRGVAAPDFLYDIKTRPAWRAGVCSDLDFPRIGERCVIGAVTVNDDSFQTGVFPAADMGVPFDAGLLQVTEKNGVVDMAHGIHIAPADGNAGNENRFFFG